MDIEMTVAAIQQEREGEAQRMALASRARRAQAPAAVWHAWHRRGAADVHLAARMRWLVHRTDAPAAGTDPNAEPAR